MRTPDNPFILSGYLGPKYFCNRSRETKWLLEQVNNERNSVLFSLRRLGKTALIRHFMHELSISHDRKSVYVDLLGSENMGEANVKIANAIIQQIGKPQKSIGSALIKLASSIGATIGFDPLTQLPQFTFNLQAPISHQTSFEALGKFLMEMKQKVVICLDEFQQIVHYPEGNAEADFRAWSQEFAGIRFLYSGSHRDMMQSMFSETTRPFYRSAQVLELQPLPDEEYRRFIRSFFQVKRKSIADEIFDEVFRWSRMQTFYIQLVFNKLYARSGSPTLNDTLETFNEIIQQDIPYFTQYKQLLTSLQWNLLRAIAVEEKVESPTAQAFLQKHNLGAASSVNAALNTLKDKDLIIYQGTHYSVHDTLLMRWLQSTK